MQKFGKRSLLYLLVCFVLVAAGVGGWLYLSNKNTSPVPKNIQRSVSFPIYYPDPAKLPAGYTLDSSSFSATGEEVIYTVSYTGNRKLIFSVQKKPSDSDLAVFYKNNIPLREEELTPAGKAAISVLNKQTFVSLPTYDGAWVIITAPQNINHKDLLKILRTITS